MAHSEAADFLACAGSLVTARAGGRVVPRRVESASGCLSPGSRTLLFGLGDAARIDSCEIRRPRGRVQHADGLRLGAVTDIAEAAEPAPTPHR